jgi:hypothetical protein
MAPALKSIQCVLFGMTLIVAASAQSSAVQSPSADQQTSRDHKSSPGAVRTIGGGAGTIGKGAAKGTGDLAKGAGKGAVDLVTLHPIDAGTSIGKGAVGAGKDVTVGTAKGTGKIVKGVGKVFSRLF